MPVDRRKRLIAEGVDPRIASRSFVPMVQHEGKYCRDRLPWGGVTNPDRCSCEGRCAHDLKGEE